MIDPIDLFNECLGHPEPFSSKEYYNTKPIITDKKINDLNKEIFLKLKGELSPQPTSSTEELVSNFVRKEIFPLLWVINVNICFKFI